MSAKTQAQSYSNRPITGALFVLGASFIFAIVGAMVKFVSVSLSSAVIVFLRNVCALIFILPWLWYSPPAGGLKTGCFRLHLVRSFTGTGALYCFFYAIAALKLSEAFLLFATAPLFIPVIAHMWMRETVANHVWVAIIIGFSGIVLILKPGFGIIQPVALVGLGAGFLGALSMVCIRRMSASEPAMRIVFYFTLLSTVMSAGPLAWSWQVPRAELWWLFLLIGLLAVLGQFMLTKGYSFAPAAQIGPFTYANIVFATLIGWIFWGETLDLTTWAGAFLICIAGIVTARRTEAHVLADATAGTAEHADEQ